MDSNGNGNNNNAGEIQTQGLSGKRNLKEFMFAGLVALLALGMVIAVVVVVVTGKNDQETIPTKSLHVRPTDSLIPLKSPQLQLDYLRTLLVQFEATKPYVEVIPSTVEALQGKESDATAVAPIRAAAWLVNVNTVQEEGQLGRRFALATVYYGMGGDQWKNKTNWLSMDLSHCDWYGVVCAGENLVSIASFNFTVQDVVELDLFDNNVVGELSEALVLLQGLQILYLAKNQITGPLKDSVLSNLPFLNKFFLQNNNLTGTIPNTLRKNNILDTFFVYANNLTGEFPTNLCPTCNTCYDNVQYFGIDCNKIKCPLTCCNWVTDCFYPDDSWDDNSTVGFGGM